METKRPLKTNFPFVLSQYLPQQATDEGSNEKDAAKEDGKNSIHDDKPHPQAAASKSGDDSPPPSKKISTVRIQAGHGGRTSDNRGQRPQAVQRERTITSLGSLSVGRMSRMRRQEAERFEHVAEVWGQARTEVLSERHSQLQEKVRLQHQLVRAQDRQAEERRQLRERQEQQKRQTEKQRKQEKDEALQSICKQSLDEDKKKAAEQRSLKFAKKPVIRDPTPVTPASTTSSDASDTNDNTSTSPTSNVATSTTTTTTGAGAAQPRPARHRGYRPSQGMPDHRLSSSPMRELENEDEEDENKARSRSGKSGSRSGGSRGEGAGGSQAVPKHHAQLYELYGKQADYFLHPKPAQVPAQRRPTHPKLKNQKIAEGKLDESGHISAGELWTTLRTDSMGKLIKTDQRFPSELKSAFSAFVRERLTRHSRPVERSFCATEDVPDIKRLMDQSKLRRTRMYRHKTELMYRSSVNNMDRTSILLHSNPLPDITETGGPDSISRYLPSWMDEQSEISEEDYMKWIKARPAIQGAPQDDDEEGEEEADKENVPRQPSGELQGILASLSRPRKQKTNIPRIHFLTEKASECQGEFTQKFLEEKEQKEKPRPHHIAKSYSVMELSHPPSSYSASSSQERGRGVQSAMQLKRYRSDWEPLSMSALIEYKAQKEVEGEGEFDHGRMKMWPVAAPASS